MKARIVLKCHHCNDWLPTLDHYVVYDNRKYCDKCAYLKDLFEIKSYNNLIKKIIKENKNENK